VSPQPTILAKARHPKPRLRKDGGVYLVRSKLKDRGQVAAQHDGQLGLVGHERYLIDQHPENFCSLGFAILVLQAPIEHPDPLAVNLRHVRMQERRRPFSVRQQLGQFCLTSFETPNLVLELNAGHTIQNGLNRSIKVPLDAFQLFALTDDVCASLNPQRLRPTSIRGSFA